MFYALGDRIGLYSIAGCGRRDYKSMLGIMKKINLQVIVGSALALLFFAAFPARLHAQSSGAQASNAGEAAERGKGTFAANCGFCHGAQANGTEQAPSLVRSRLVRQDLKGEVLGPMIKAGRPALGMPAFASLPPQQISDIIAFLHKRARETRGNVVPESAILVGNAEAGKAYFDGPGQCNSCHSPTGDLAGVGAKLGLMALTTAFLTPPAKPIEVKVTLPSGETISGTLDYIDEFTVSLFDASRTYHSWSRDRLRSLTMIDPLAEHKALLAKYTDHDIHNLLAYLVTLK
jgi:cytochrome c oxidase cbb3-type subunit III